MVEKSDSADEHGLKIFQNIAVQVMRIGYLKNLLQIVPPNIVIRSPSNKVKTHSFPYARSERVSMSEKRVNFTRPAFTSTFRARADF